MKLGTKNIHFNQCGKIQFCPAASHEDHEPFRIELIIGDL